MDRWRRGRARAEAAGPRDPQEAAAAEGEAAPLLLAREGAHGPVVHAACPAAHALGVRPGARVVDVRAAHPGLRVARGDPEGDAAALGALALWCRRWSPWTARDGACGVVMDATGAAHLWGGEAGLLAEVEARLAALGYAARTAMAPTRGAAWALARFGAARSVCGPDDLAVALAPLPARALRLDAETCRLLDRLGLRTVGALAGVPRAALARRFRAADGPLAALDRAMGRLPEPVDAPAEPPRFLVRAVLAEPATDAAPHLPGLARDLAAALGAAGRGARLLRLAIFRADGQARAVTAATARASADPAHLARLLAAKLERLDPGPGFDAVTLAAARTEALAPLQPGLDRAPDASRDLAALIDRLSARLGPRAVTWPAWAESHLPERAERRVPALSGAPSAPPAIAAGRPIRLLEPPEEVRVVYSVPEGAPGRFVWRRVTYETARQRGPERLAPEWWRERPGTRLRDYYVVEASGGRRFWLYREGIIGDGRGGLPRWFVHGLFA